MTQVDAVLPRWKQYPRRNKRTPKPRQPFDKRTMLGRRVVELATTFCARLGEDASDPILLVQVERAARLVAYSEVLSAKALRADPAVSADDVIRASRAADHAMRGLRLDRHIKAPGGLSLADLLREERQR
jgi:hypothetical protein